MPIVIHSDRPPSQIDWERVYFAFPSGVFSYDCATCGAQCCRGHGYTVNGHRELQPQIQTHAEVRFFLDPCDALATHYHMQNFAPGCFFLTGDRRCRIQIDRGFDAKPATCRFFPFNGLFRLGTHLVVVPHSQLCPIDVVTPGTSGYSNHGALLRTLSAFGIDDHVHELRPAGLPESNLIALERAIVRLAENQAITSYSAFAAAQRVATETELRKTTNNDVIVSKPAVTCEQIRHNIDNVLGVSGAVSDDAEVVRLLIAMTPTLRATMVFTTPGDRPSLVDLRTLPSFLLAAHSLSQLAVKAGMERVSYQTVMRVVKDNRALLVLLSQLDSVLMWKPEVPIDLSFGGEKSFRTAFVRIAQALLPDVQRNARSSLGDLLHAHAPSDWAQRTEFIRRLAKRFDGRLVHFDRRGLLSRLTHSPRATMQQLALGSMTPETAASLMARVTSRRRTAKA
jgi:hypothetical protein